MKIVNKSLLRAFARPGACEHCHRNCPDGRDPAHVEPRRMGGATRVDSRMNLCSLCRACHSASEAGKEPTRAKLWDIVGRREGVPAAVAKAWVLSVVRLSKWGQVPDEPKPGRYEAMADEPPF